VEKLEYRSYILVGFKNGKTPTDISNELNIAHGTAAPSYQTVRIWFNRFADGHDDLEDKGRPGRPITAVTNDNIWTVRALIEDDRHITYDQIVAHTSLGRNAIQTIIHDHLLLNKLTSRWVPHSLNDEQKEARVSICRANLDKFNNGKWRLCDIVTGDESWIYHRKLGNKQSNASWVEEGEAPSIVQRKGQYEAKSMVTIFFKSTGPLYIGLMNKGETIDADYYIKRSLSPMITALNKDRPKSGTDNVKILHDNAKPHDNKKVENYLERKGIATISHPPYSPDLAPCDYWLFSYIKQRLDDHTSGQSLKYQITKILAEIPKEEWLKTFQKYLERMQLCIDNQGDYFEHLIK